MADRNEAETLDLVQDVTKIVKNFNAYLAGQFTTDINDLTAELAVGDEVDENGKIADQLDRVISSAEGLWDTLLQLVRSSYPAIGRLGSSPDLGSQNTNLDFFQQYAVTNSKEIEKRGFTKDTATAITGAGAGLITISSTDVNGDIIDVGHVEDLTFKCVRDVSGGATVGREQFQIQGTDSAAYRWLENGSNLGRSYDYPYGQVSADFGPAQARAITGAIITANSGSSASGNLVRNGDFETVISGSGTTKLSQWTISTGDAGVANETTDPILGDTSLAITTDFVMDHNFGTGRLRPNTFYFISVKLDRLASATGTLTVKVMDVDEGTTHATLTQDISTLTNDTPVPIQPVIFFVPESAEDLKVQVELASLATGTLTIDDVVVAPATLVDGYLVAIMDGTTQNTSKQAQGRFKRGDSFVIQTTSAEGGTIQKFYLNMASSRYIRSATSATAGWEDPA